MKYVFAVSFFSPIGGQSMSIDQNKHGTLPSELNLVTSVVLPLKLEMLGLMQHGGKDSQRKICPIQHKFYTIYYLFVLYIILKSGKISTT